MCSEHRPASPHHAEVNGVREWAPDCADAWIGLLETHRRLSRELDAELEARHGLSVSGLELLGRLARAGERPLRLSELAEQAGLSLSRVSRIFERLERRGLVARHACPTDGRAVHARITPEGLGLLRRAQATHFAGVEERFFRYLSQEEIAALARVFARFAPDAARRCGAARG
jgi:DNA-binding MarR family transcriptional regulator